MATSLQQLGWIFRASSAFTSTFWGLGGLGGPLGRHLGGTVSSARTNPANHRAADSVRSSSAPFSPPQASWLSWAHAFGRGAHRINISPCLFSHVHCGDLELLPHLQNAVEIFVSSHLDFLLFFPSFFFSRKRVLLRTPGWVLSTANGYAAKMGEAFCFLFSLSLGRSEKKVRSIVNLCHQPSIW